jgi:hypothetical protein
MKLALLLLVVFSLNAQARDYDNKSNYKSKFGNEYEYDLSRPADQIRYENDIRAQMRDELDVDPRREIERDLGQYGGGKVKKRRY